MILVNDYKNKTILKYKVSHKSLNKYSLRYKVINNIINLIN